jgi:putative hydrolase of the HAD superfamily
VTRVTTVFFDAGHTLLHAYPSVPEIYAAEARARGSPVTSAEIAAVYPAIWRDFTRHYAADAANNAMASEAQDRSMWRGILTRLVAALPSMGALEFDAWFDAVYERFGTSDVWRLYDDARPALRALRAAGVRTAIVSNWDARLRKIAAGLGLDDLVEFAVISAECGSRKPDRRIFDLALERAGADPAASLHVGDLYDEDVVGATRAGIRAVLLDRHGAGAPGHAEGDFHRVGGLREVVRIVTSRTSP